LIRRKILDNDFYGMTYSLKYNRRSFDLYFRRRMNQYIGDHYGHIIWARVWQSYSKNHQWYFNEGRKTISMSSENWITGFLTGLILW
jgi:iron complex outermembrane recepter protein